MAQSFSCVDYFSKYPEIMRLIDTTSEGIITAMKSIFSKHGIPDIVVPYNGPQNVTEEFRKFAESWEFIHLTSSPGWYIALLEHRNTPLEGVGLSLVQMLMGCHLKTKLLASTYLLTPERALNVQGRLKERKAKQRGYYDVHAKRLPELHAGDKLRMQSGDKWKSAVVLKQHDQPRSYVVCTRRRFMRNRKHLRSMAEIVFPPAAESSVTDVMDCNNTLLTRSLHTLTLRHRLKARTLVTHLTSHSCTGPGQGAGASHPK